MATFHTSNTINFGKRILPIKMVEIFSADEWEIFIEEWLDTKKKEYVSTDRFGGAGDKGRDVVAYITTQKSKLYSWDCYQCKHYDKSLQPNHVYCEFGKILYYTFIEEFPIPNNYFFIAPKGCGTTLSKFLQEPLILKDKIKENWDKYCKDEITNEPILLEGKFLDYVNNFNFSIFSKIHIKNIIEEHSKHPNHLIWFGGGLPDRPKLEEKNIPQEIQIGESIYVKQLLLAYGSESKSKYLHPKDLSSEEIYHNHFSRSRINFHYAEQLRNFSRDSLPPNTFDDFQNEIYQGVIDLTDESFENGFLKVKKVEQESRRIQITSNPLKEVSVVNDRNGICHQLVNDGKFKWLKDEY